MFVRVQFRNSYGTGYPIALSVCVHVIHAVMQGSGEEAAEEEEEEEEGELRVQGEGWVNETGHARSNGEQSFGEASSLSPVPRVHVRGLARVSAGGK